MERQAAARHEVFFTSRVNMSEREPFDEMLEAMTPRERVAVKVSVAWVTVVFGGLALFAPQGFILLTRRAVAGIGWRPRAARGRVTGGRVDGAVGVGREESASARAPRADIGYTLSRSGQAVRNFEAPT